MDNFFNNGPNIFKLIDLKAGFLRIFFWTFIEVKQTIA